MQFIDLTIQQDAIREELNRRIATVLSHGQYIMGPEVQELEDVLRDFAGVSHCITVSSGTEALLISLMALGIGPGDEVITTPFTFISTAEVIVLLGATPVFVDVERDTGLIDAELIEERITARTKAIMPVSLYGQIADMNAINEIAARHGNIPVIEDAAQSFGATYYGQRSCGLSTIGCTSFFPSKPLGCYGDGGAIFTDDINIAAKARAIRVHGQTERYVHTTIGVCGRLDTIQAAVLLAKFPRFSWELTQRSRIANRYEQEFLSKGLSFVNPLRLRPSNRSAFAQYTITVEARDSLQESLRTLGIPTVVHYPKIVTEQRAYSTHEQPSRTPVAEWLCKRVLSLPIGPDLSQSAQDAVISSLAILRVTEPFRSCGKLATSHADQPSNHSSANV